MSEYFLVEYGQVYELRNRDGFVYCIITKNSACSEVLNLLIDHFVPEQITMEKFDKIKGR